MASEREPVNVSPAQAAFIVRRVLPLVQRDRAPIDLAGDAYIQGLSDAAEYFNRRARQ